MQRSEEQQVSSSVDANSYVIAHDEDSRRQIPRLPDEQANASDNGTTNEVEGGAKRTRLRAFTNKTKAKSKKFLGMEDEGSAYEGPESDCHGYLWNIERDPAFSHDHLYKHSRQKDSGTTSRPLGALGSIATTVLHPKKAIKSKATRTTAGQLSKAERPFISQKADLELLEAHDNLHHAESIRSPRQTAFGSEGDDGTSGYRERIKEIQNHRESLRVAWTTRKHVRRVRVVPKQHIAFPDNDHFIRKDMEEEHFDWLSWLGWALIYATQNFCAQYIDEYDKLPYDISTLRLCIERLVIASAPWQSWAMDVRAVYRWENPKTTGKWLALYTVLWYTEHIVSFVWAYLIYVVIKNRFYPTSVESLRKSMQKALDSRSTASKFGELIDKHGREHWLEPLMEDLGPYVQLQLGDVANLLEVLDNLYHWRYPQKTVASLYFFGSALIFSLFASAAFCIKLIWFLVGLVFFVCWPISSLHPKYRYLVSPFKWVLWDIPTNAEWSFQYMRRQAQISREQLIKQKVEANHSKEAQHPHLGVHVGNAVHSFTMEDGVMNDDDDDDDDWHSASSSTSILEDSDIIAFRAHSNGIVGRLVVFSGGVRFVRSLGQKEIWRRSFLELAEMRKVEGSTMARLTMASRQQIELKFTNGSTLLEGMKDRDEAFNSILGFSGLQWQALQGHCGYGAKCSPSVVVSRSKNAGQVQNTA